MTLDQARRCINHILLRTFTVFANMISSFSEPIPVSSSTYQTTSSGNLISVRARIYGATAIVLHGRNVVEAGVILRGDLRRFLGPTTASSKTESDGQMALVMGRYCRIGEDSVVRPPGKMTKGYVQVIAARCMFCPDAIASSSHRVFNYYKLSISDCVDIGERCVVEALSIGKGVKIGDDCTIVSLHRLRSRCRSCAHLLLVICRASLPSSGTTPS